VTLWPQAQARQGTTVAGVAAWYTTHRYRGGVAWLVVRVRVRVRWAPLWGRVSLVVRHARRRYLPRVHSARWCDAPSLQRRRWSRRRGCERQWWARWPGSCSGRCREPCSTAPVITDAATATATATAATASASSATTNATAITSLLTHCDGSRRQSLGCLCMRRARHDRGSPDTSTHSAGSAHRRWHRGWCIPRRWSLTRRAVLCACCHSYRRTRGATVAARRVGRHATATGDCDGSSPTPNHGRVV